MLIGAASAGSLTVLAAKKLRPRSPAQRRPR
jgi:hypothetical protein